MKYLTNYCNAYLMMIGKTRIFIIATILAHNHVSECAQVDFCRPDNVVDVSKITSHRRDAKPVGLRNRGRLRIPKQKDVFNLEHDLIIVPGQNGMIGDSAASFVCWLRRKYLVVRATFWADFGQKNCMQDFCDVVLKKADSGDDNNGYVLFGTSQGTATSVNFFNRITQGEKVELRNPKALILQSVMLSGNSAIYHTVTKMIFPLLAYLPGSYYWLPYLAKIGYWSYSPAGDQPVYHVEKIPADLPVIILHCTNDQQLSFQDAQGLYAALCRGGNRNVYFVEMPDSDGEVNHFVTFTAQIKRDILTILKKHGVIENVDSLYDSLDYALAFYQPEIKQEWLNHFDNVLRKEKRISYVDMLVKGVMIGCIAYLFCAKGIAKRVWCTFIDFINRSYA